MLRTILTRHTCFVALALSLAIAGCGRTTLLVDSTDDASIDPERDAGPDAGRDLGIDAGPPDLGRDFGIDPRDLGFDAGPDCRGDRDCDDGSFCNGAERCAAGRCVFGAPIACPSDRCADGFCDEAARACVRIPRDGDGDGVIGVECGGEDCDDTNPLISPFAAELCDGGADEDCDALADCADTDCALEPMCATGPCPERDLGSALGVVSRGTTVGASAGSAGTCAASSPAPELAFRWAAPSNGTFAFDTRGSALDTVLYVRAGSCSGAELACDDDSAGAQDSLVRLPLAIGDVVILVVDGFGSGAGAYLLNITLESGMEICNNGRDDDRDGLLDCADPDCAGSPLCCAPVAEVCGNGIDDDCDRAVDCADPDCMAAPACCMPSPEVCNNGRDDDCDRRVDCGDTDCATNPICCVPTTEDCSNGRDDDCDALVDCADPVCTTAPACCAMRIEICSNTVDDDCDGRADCLDPDCTIDPRCAPTCPESDLGGMLGASIATGSTVGAGNDQTASCGGRASGPDRTFGWTAPRTATYVFDTIGSAYDTVLQLRQGTCIGPELACDDDSGGSLASRITRTITAGTRIVIVMDGFGMSAGTFVLNVRTLTSEVGLCLDAVDNDGDGPIDCADADCAADTACCMPVPEVCSDMIDNDCDRVVDCADPNCSASPSCCTPRMEICDNFTDDDCDGFVDCVDSSCAGRPPC